MSDTPLSTILEVLQQQAQIPTEKTELEKDAETLLKSLIPKLYKDLAYFAEATSALTRKHGLYTLIGALPIEFRQPVGVLLQNLSNDWSHYSSKAMPEIYLEPQPPITNPPTE